jgi:hypothetical protein
VVVRGTEPAPRLDTGCCSIGWWLPQPVVLKGRVRGRTLFLLRPSG